MVRKLVLALLFLGSLASCSEDEVIPRTNPRFSVAFVQMVDRSGAEFAANVYDLGSEEISEYGFVYGRNTGLSIEKDNFVSENGSPGKEFRLKSTHSMPLGANIFVSAFIKTNQGVVYSQPYRFVSQGSDGFLFDRIEIPQEVYFGDTLIVYGSKLSRVPTDYTASIQRVPAIVTKIKDGSFGVVIPRSVTFQEGVGQIQDFEFEFKVSDKVLKVNKPIKFKSPKFTLGSPNEVAYTEDLIIRGEYLYDDNMRVRYINSSGNNFLLKVTEPSDGSVKIGLNALFTEPNPKLELLIRGQVYPLEGFLKLKETKINSGQVIKFRGFTGIAKIIGENFNPFLEDYNQFKLSPDIFKVDILSISPSEMEISFEYKFEKGPGSRISELRMTNAGISSTNSFQFEWTSQGIPYVLTEDYSFTLGEGKTVGLGGKGYMINSLGIYEIDPSTRSFNRIANSPSPGMNPASMFAIPAEDKIYFGTYSNQEVRTAEKLFFVFDPSTRSVKSLPKIPSPDNSFQSAVFYQGNIYYQGDEIDLMTGKDGNIKRYRFNLAAQTWEKLLDLNQPDEMANSFSSFEYKGKIYSTSIYQPNPFSLVLGLYKFNTATYAWDLLGPIRNTESTAFQKFFIIDDIIYVLGNNRLGILDLESREFLAPEYLAAHNGFAQSPNSFQLGNRFYLYTGIAFWQYDPNYFY